MESTVSLIVSFRAGRTGRLPGEYGMAGGGAAMDLGHGQLLLRILLIAFFFHHPADTIKALPYLGKGKIERRKPQANVIGCTKVRNDV